MFLPSGKLERPSIGSPGDGTKEINRLYLSDRTFKSKYLIDTGAHVSVVPLIEASKNRPPASLQLFAANRTVISTYKGISPIPEKVVAATNFSKPGTVKELRCFLANCSSYRRFIPHVAGTQAVLNSYLKGAKRNNRTPILWSEDSTAVFEKCKKDLEESCSRCITCHRGRCIGHSSRCFTPSTGT
ncbi:retrovirus-related Pol polyprotein from transposon 297 [Nephila pilipes]|uniref:Retrovirus-related Pol polyprotein from transposon 297 n=1 Tax=Nephila pilipes TaxID=299642 RepID=A0A8X6PG54_NEPPI|nr:retrovirus-related Pol polyprotein from transposon 297 [Nephila pilipes]